MSAIQVSSDICVLVSSGPACRVVVLEIALSECVVVSYNSLDKAVMSVV